MYYPQTTKFSRLFCFAKTEGEVASMIEKGMKANGFDPEKTSKQESLSKKHGDELQSFINKETAKKRQDDSVNSAVGGNASGETKSPKTQTKGDETQKPDANSILQELKGMKEITWDSPKNQMFTGEELGNFKKKLDNLKSKADNYHIAAEGALNNFRGAYDKYENLSGLGKLLSQAGATFFGKGKLADARRAHAAYRKAQSAAEISKEAYNKTRKGVLNLTNETANKEELDGIQKEFEKNRNDISGFGRFMDWVSGGTVFRDKALNKAISHRDNALLNLRKQKGAGLLALDREIDLANEKADGFRNSMKPKNLWQKVKRWDEGRLPWFYDDSSNNNLATVFSRPRRRVVYNGTLLSRNFSHRTPQRYYPVPVYPHYYR